MNISPLVNCHCHKLPRPGVIGIMSIEPGNPLPETEHISMGLHPWRLDNWRERLTMIEEAAASGRLTAIGECGLDRVRASHDFDIQLTAFGAQAEIAARYKLPIIVHCVRAVPETIALKKLHPGVPAWILHGFNSNIQLLHDALRHGFYISFGPHAKPQLIKETPVEKMFLETDDSNSNIATHYQAVTKLLEIDLETFRKSIYDNFSINLSAC